MIGQCRESLKASKYGASSVGRDGWSTTCFGILADFLRTDRDRLSDQSVFRGCRRPLHLRLDPGEIDTLVADERKF